MYYIITCVLLYLKCAVEDGRIDNNQKHGCVLDYSGVIITNFLPLMVPLQCQLSRPFVQTSASAWQHGTSSYRRNVEFINNGEWCVTKHI